MEVVIIVFVFGFEIHQSRFRPLGLANFNSSESQKVLEAIAASESEADRKRQLLLFRRASMPVRTLGRSREPVCPLMREALHSQFPNFVDWLRRLRPCRRTVDRWLPVVDASRTKPRPLSY